jgi:flavodoxin
MKRLVVYYSRTGTTKELGEAIAQALGADTDEIIDQKQRMGKIAFIRAGKDAMGGKLTKIEVKRNPEEYDVIIIGTPIWASRVTPAVRTYLTTYNFSGKQLFFFITQQGESRDRAFTQMQELTPESDHIGTFGIQQKVVEAGEYQEQLESLVAQITDKAPL